MTVITLPNSGLSAGYVDGETGWGAGMNLNLRVIDALMNLRVIDKDLATPPSTPGFGDTYIVSISPTGAWSGKTGQIAIYMSGSDISPGWTFLVPKSNWKAFIVDEGVEYVFNGSSWSSDQFAWNLQSGDYTLQSGDANKGVEMNSASANVFTVAPNSTAPIAVGKSVIVAQYGSGATSIAAGSGVTVRSRGGILVLTGQYSMVTLIKRAVNEWYLAGDLT